MNRRGLWLFKAMGVFLFLFSLLTVLPGTAVSTVLFEDDFSGTFIDSSKWTTSTPCAYSDSDCSAYASVTQDDSLMLIVTRDNYVFAKAVSVMTFEDWAQSAECKVWQDATSSWQNWGAVFFCHLGSIGYYNVTSSWIVHWTGPLGESRSQTLSMPSMQPWQHFNLKIQLSGNELQWLYDMDDGAGYRFAFSTVDFSLPFRTFWAGPEEVGKVVLAASDPGTTYFDDVRVRTSSCAHGELTSHLEIEEGFDAPINVCDYVVSGVAAQDAAAGDFVLTTADMFATGSIFSSQRVSQLSSVVASFDFSIGGGSGADGITFAMIPGPNLLGPDGGFMGYEGLGGYAVEIDTYYNGWDPSENHVAVLAANATNHLCFNSDVPEIENTGWFHCDLIFTNGRIVVFLENETAGYPQTKVIDFEIPAYVPFDAHIGLTGATGGETNFHIIDNISISAMSAGPSELSHIFLTVPADQSLHSGPPSFGYVPVGGTSNVFAIDASLSPSFTSYWSTYKNLHQLIYETSWTMPLSVWNRIPPGTRVYWRVRGADLDVQPLTIVTSNQVWSFIKQ